MYRKIFLPLLFLVSIIKLTAQENYYHYFVYLKDKPLSEFSIDEPFKYLSAKAIERRQKFKIAITAQDLPVNTSYVAQINVVEGCEIWTISKWMNAVEIKSKDAAINEKILTLPFVSAIKFLGKVPVNNKALPSPVEPAYLLKSLQPIVENHPITSDTDYGDAFEQNMLINLWPLHEKKYSGSGITIAVFDAGFSNVYKTPGMNIDFKHIVVKDFVTHDNSVWEDDQHGANVLGFMKTNNPGIYIGTAPLANYILLRTEDAASEYPVEEVNWLAAAEFADSIGADLISSSLGYNNFDDQKLSYKYSDLDGKTSIISKAADIAKSKGIFIVVSAGNEGASTWHKIGTPSDAKGVITIGATDTDGTHADFSSYGPSADGRIKPDFVVMGKKAIVASPKGNYAGNGTSYATPIFAGALACLMQACPGKSHDEIFKALVCSATHQNMPDSAYGYGLPDMALAAAIAGNYMGMDTTKDILWQNFTGTQWTPRTFHFRSSQSQTIEIKILGKKKKRIKTLKHEKIILGKGEWIHYDVPTTLNKIKHKNKYKNIQVLVITPSVTFSR